MSVKRTQCDLCGSRWLSAALFWANDYADGSLRVPLVCNQCGRWNWWRFTPSEPTPKGANDAPVHRDSAANKGGESHAGKH